MAYQIKNRQLDKDGDYAFGIGIHNYVFDLEAVIQAIKTKLMLFNGEWWEQIDDGIPVFTSILGQPQSETLKNTISMFIVNRTEKVYGVQSVRDIQVEFTNDRHINASMNVQTVFGNAEIEVII